MGRGQLTVSAAKRFVRGLDFRDLPGRGDRMVHATGFGDDGIELRPTGRGNNNLAIMARNAGVSGPIAAEFGYGSKMIRVRLFRGHDLLRIWDVQMDANPETLDRLRTEFVETLDLALHEDELTRAEWVAL